MPEKIASSSRPCGLAGLKKAIKALKVGGAYKPNEMMNNSMNAGLELALMRINEFEAGLKERKNELEQQQKTDEFHVIRDMRLCDIRLDELCRILDSAEETAAGG